MASFPSHRVPVYFSAAGQPTVGSGPPPLNASATAWPPWGGHMRGAVRFYMAQKVSTRGSGLNPDASKWYPLKTCVRYALAMYHAQ